MKRCAFLTMRSLEGFVNDDALLHAPLAKRGWRVEAVPWDQVHVRWEEFDAVLIRSTWDYAQKPAKFLATLEAIDRCGTRLENPLPIVRWNMDKRYLLNLQRRGVSIVPTLIAKGIGKRQIQELFDNLEADDIVLKPVVGANANRVHRLRQRDGAPDLIPLTMDFQDRAYLAQPFLKQIESEGEFSLFFFGGAYSHAILKTPRPQDYRVQEEHGGIIQAVTPEPELLSCARKVLDTLGTQLLYARVDLVRATGGGFLLMELELIEPSLYWRMDAQAPARFARAFDEWVRSHDARTAGEGWRRCAS